MSFNGSGTFVINTAGQPVVANTVISATVFNALTSDLATGLSTCITKDGQTTVTANIPFGNNKITSLGAGTAATDASNMSQVQSTAAKLITVTGTDTITGTMSPALASYAAGQLFYFIANAANTGAMTINIDGLGAKSITRDGSTALIAGDVNTGEIVVICYDGTRFQMINAANSFGNTTINGTLTVTGNTGLQANVSITSALSVGGVFAVTGAATLGSTLAVTGKSDLPTVSTASMNAAVAVVTTGTVTNLTSTSASIASMNAGVALLTTATVTTLTATGASIASANIGNLQFTAASIASINAGVAVITNLTATSASIASVNAGVALLTTATITGLTATGASIASANAGTATLSGNLTLNGGTANGVLYLNASKVATSGTAITFDGTNLGIGTTSPAGRVHSVPATVNAGLSAAFVTSQGGSGANTGSSIRLGYGTSAGAYAEIGGAYQDPGTYLTFRTNADNVSAPTERMRLDASGNLGLGVPPNANWNLGKALEIGTSTGNVLWGIGINATSLLSNGYYNSGYKYSNTGYATRYDCGGGNGTHAWHIAASGTAGNAITFTQAMTLDASGNLGLTSGKFFGFTSTPSASAYSLYGDANTTVLNGPSGGVVQFNIANSEQMRLTTTGLGIGTTSPGVRLDVVGASAGSTVARFTSNETGSTTPLAVFQRSGGAVSAAIKYNASNSPLTIDFGTTTSHALTFLTADTERARFNTTGAFVFAGGTTTADGIGITFPATQSASSNANTLDDYEEGTWTVAFPSGTGTFTSRSARYTKIGRQVFAEWDFTVNTIGTSSASQFSGLPFTQGGSISGGTIAFWSSAANGIIGVGGCYASTTLIYLTGSTTSQTTATDWNAMGNGTRITGAITYTV